MSPPADAAVMPRSQHATALAKTEGYGPLFRNRNFMALWLGQIFSQLADRIIFVVFITLIVDNFGAQGSLKSFLYVAFTIPAIMLTAAAGVFVDRWPRKETLVTTTILRALIVATIPLALKAHSLIALYACAFGISTITQFFTPAESATIPMITPSQQLLVANSLFTTTMMGSIIFGFALGDPLINLFGIRQIHWAIVGLFLLSSVFLCFVNAKKPVNATVNNSNETIKPTLQAFWDEMREGIDYLRENPIVLYKMIKLCILFSAVVAMCILYVSFAQAYLYADPDLAARKFSWLVTFSGLGMVIGALWVGNGLREMARSKLVYRGFSMVGLGILALILAQYVSQRSVFPVLLPYLRYRILYAHAITVFLGMGAAFIAVPLQSVLHELIPEDKRGKVMGVQFTLLSTCSTLPVLLAGFGADYLGVSPMLALLGLPLLILGVHGLYTRKKYGNGDDVATW